MAPSSITAIACTAWSNSPSDCSTQSRILDRGYFGFSGFCFVLFGFFVFFFVHFEAVFAAMVSAAAVLGVMASASASSLLLPNRCPWRGRNGSVRVARWASLPGLNLVKAASSRRRSVVAAAADDLEQKQTEQQEQQILQDALQDTMSNLGAKGAETKSILKSREGLEETFAVLNTGAYACRSCGHVYEEAKGDSSYPVAAGTLFRDLPEDWLCPTCGAAKGYFQPKSVEVAGFAQNQQFGLGGNTLTSGQKSLLIYGSLLFFFALFLSGYFLQ